MGSSTRNKYIRSSKLILQGISDGKITVTGSGIGSIMKDVFFSSKGISQPRKTLQEKLYSKSLRTSLQKISKLSKAISNKDFSAIGIDGNYSLYSHDELSEIFCEYLGIENDEVLKTSFKESISDSNIIENGLNILKISANYVKNIISNIFKQYTFEDSLDCLPKMTEEDYEAEMDNFSNKNILPVIDFELEKIEFNDDNISFTEIEKSLRNIMLKLKRIGD